MSQEDKPTLTVAMVVGEQRRRAEKGLGLLLAQTALRSIEILVLDTCSAGSDLGGAGHPSVRYLRRPEIRHYSSARAECVREARGELIAFIEDHCYASPEWAGAVIDAFRRPVAIVNYSFAGAGHETYLTRSFLFAEYGRWMAPAKRGLIRAAACSNIAYRLDALSPFRDRLEQWFEIEFVLHRRIQRNGGTIWWEPGAVVGHQDWLRFSDGCRANGAFRRMMSGCRVAHEGWGWGSRLTYAAGMLLAPPLHFWRLGASLWNRPALWPLFFTSFPVSLAVYCYASYQEALGYLWGAGSSREEFRAVELTAPRAL